MRRLGGFLSGAVVAALVGFIYLMVASRGEILL